MPNSPVISIFDIPLIVELICDFSLSKQDIKSCLQVCRLWHTIFRPHLIRYVRFADLKASQTQHVVENAHRIRHLEIDISDAECFLEPTQCIGLKALSCVDFGYMPWPTNDAGYSDTRLELLHPVDPDMNALRLIDQNPKLQTLSVEHNRRHYGLSHFSPDVLSALSNHRSLSLIKLDLNYRNQDDPKILVSILRQLPLSLQDLEIHADWTMGGDILDEEPLFSNNLGALQRLCLKGTYFGRVPCKLIFQFLERCPNLKELSFQNITCNLLRLVQTVERFCPFLESFTLRNHDYVYGGDRLIGHLSNLREFVFDGIGDYDNDNEALDIIFNFLARSGPSLEILKVDIRGGGKITGEMLSRLSTCVNLKTLWFTADDLDRDYPYTNGEELWVDLPSLMDFIALGSLCNLKSLRLRVSEVIPGVCSRNYWIRWGSQIQGINSEIQEHIKGFVVRAVAFLQSLYTLLALEEISLGWTLCDMLRGAPQELVFSFLAQQLNDASMMEEQFKIIGLTWPTLSKIKMQEAMRMEQESYSAMRDEAMTAWRTKLNHIGRNWVDWMELEDMNDHGIATAPYKELETYELGLWYWDRKKYFKTGKSHHRHSLKSHR